MLPTLVITYFEAAGPTRHYQTEVKATLTFHRVLEKPVCLPDKRITHSLSSKTRRTFVITASTQVDGTEHKQTHKLHHRRLNPKLTLLFQLKRERDGGRDAHAERTKSVTVARHDSPFLNSLKRPGDQIRCWATRKLPIRCQLLFVT